MSVLRAVLPESIPEIHWVVDELIPQAFVSMLYGRQGEGKTQVAAYLAVQAARPAGKGTFAGRPVASGWSLILDADDPASVGYAIWVNRFISEFPDAERGAISLRRVRDGLTPADVKQLRDELKDAPPLLVILDAFSSAFLGLDVIRPHEVHEPIRALADFAAELGSAVLVLDHVGKLAPGQTVADKGPLGASAKLYAPRAAFALDRLPPKDTDGKTVYRLTCTKQSYAPTPAPFGLELVFTGPDRADLRPYPLPDVVSLEQKAEIAILDFLRGLPSGAARKEVLAHAIVKANVSERTAKRALQGLVTRGTVVAESLPGQGAPVLLRLATPPVVPEGTPWS